MKTITENSRRNFLSTSIKSAIILGTGASIGNIINPVTALAQNADAALQEKIAQLGTASLQTSQLALTKASHPEVKLFAKFEAAEQEAMARILRGIGTQVSELNAEGKTLLSKLQTLNGAAFDKAFMQGQVDTHQKLHQEVSSLNSATKSMHVKNVTSLALTTIKEHTERGQTLTGKLG